VGRRRAQPAGLQRRRALRRGDLDPASCSAARTPTPRPSTVSSPRWTAAAPL